MTDFTEIDQRARLAAERLRETVDDSIPSLDEVIRRRSQKRARGMTVMAAVLICAVVGVGALGASTMRTGTGASRGRRKAAAGRLGPPESD